jgi:hypothetical protein
MRLEAGFGGDRLGLTDQYSVPFDDGDEFYNVFNIGIGADGMLLSASLKDGHWHVIDLKWNTAAKHCVVSVDGKIAGTVRAQRASAGIDYLRFHALPTSPDGGLLVSAIDADVAPAYGPGQPRMGSTATDPSDGKNRRGTQ